MQLVRIAGPTEPMRALSQIAGLDFERTSARRVADDRWQVAGYATDEALAELQRRGLSVEAIVGAEELERQRASVFAQIEPDDRDGGDDGGDDPDADRNADGGEA